MQLQHLADINLLSYKILRGPESPSTITVFSYKVGSITGTTPHIINGSNTSTCYHRNMDIIIIAEEEGIKNVVNAAGGAVHFLVHHSS